MAIEWDKIKTFRGEWVAIFEKRVIAHGKTLKIVHGKALKVCKEPEFFQVPTQQDEVYILCST